MMLYSVRDLKVGKYGIPFIMDNDMTAIRSFLLSLADVTHPSPMTAFPMDFELFQVGEFDFVTGQVIPLSEGPRFVASAGSCQDQFSLMQKKYIQLAESISTKKITDQVREKVTTFKSSFLSELGEHIDYDEYNLVTAALDHSLASVGFAIEEDNVNE